MQNRHYVNGSFFLSFHFSSLPPAVNHIARCKLKWDKTWQNANVFISLYQNIAASFIQVWLIPAHDVYAISVCIQYIYISFQLNHFVCMHFSNADKDNIAHAVNLSMTHSHSSEIVIQNSPNRVWSVYVIKKKSCIR